MKIFLSGVASEFRECRISLASDLRAMGADVVVQEDLQQKAGSLLEKLQTCIDQCDRVILLLGDAYGVEAVIPSDLRYSGEPRSYTEWEYFFAIGERLDGAVRSAKVIHVYCADENFKQFNSITQTVQQAESQQAFVESVLATGLDRSSFGSLDELCRLVIRDGFRLPVLPSSSPEAGEIQSYMRFLGGHLDHIDIASPAQAVSAAGVGVKVPALIESVCTKARVRRVLRLTRSQDTLDISETERDIFAAIADAGTRIVLLGQPGSGKTTMARWLCLRYIALYLAGRSFSIPIYVPLRRVDISAISTVDQLIDAALADLDQFTEHPGLRSYLKSNHNRLSIIMDGLDELPMRSVGGESRKDSLQRLYKCLDIFLDSDEGHQIILTSRLQDYLLNSYFQYLAAEHLLISDLKMEQIEEGIDSWHRAAQAISVSAQEDGVDWFARASSIRNLVRNNTDLASFAANPLCLNLLQLVYDESDVRYLSVSRICELAIKTLLLARVSDELPSSVVESGMSKLAYHELLVTVLSDIAVVAVDSLAAGGDGTVPFDALQASVTMRVGATTATGFLEYGSLVHPIMTEIVRGQGVLISMNAQSFMFAHSLFRDTLAGRALRALGLDECIRRASSSTWTRVFRHIAGLALDEGAKLFEAIALAHALYDRSRLSGSPTLLAAAAEIFGEICMSGSPTSDTSLFQSIVSDVRLTLISFITNQAIPDDGRVELGVLLGRIGDPRIGSSRVSAENATIGFVGLAEGRFDLGGGGKEGDEGITNPKYRSVFPALLQNVHVNAFSIGRYLVTNDEYAEFIEDGGYATDVYWLPNGALEWLREDERTMERLRALMRDTSMTHFYTDLHNGRVTEIEINDAIDAMLFRKLPLYWYSGTLNGPNQPVVGVNWWEAKAYAKWYGMRKAPGMLTGQLAVDLPTEYEWERSARQSARNPSDTIWLAGSAEVNAHWNRLHRSCAAPAPVGIYPWGSPSPDGPHDLIGNVWEWTSSIRHQYSAEDVHNAFSNFGLTERIVRGGSWLSSEPLSATISFRSFDPPCNAYDDLGFRVALAPRIQAEHDGLG